MEDIHNEGRRTRLAPYRVLAIIERLDRSVTNVFSPIGITTLGFFTLYYTALSYGFVVIGIMGGRAGLTRLVASSSSHPMLVIIGVPMIPVGLVLLEAAELEEKTLLLWRKKVSPFISQLPVFGSIINYLWPSLTREPFIGNQMGGVASTVDYLARSISGGLMLPFVGYAIGRTLFKSRTSNVERTLLVSGLYRCMCDYYYTRGCWFGLLLKLVLR